MLMLAGYMGGNGLSCAAAIAVTLTIDLGGRVAKRTRGLDTGEDQGMGGGAAPG
jgi:hypothetical protein